MTQARHQGVAARSSRASSRAAGRKKKPYKIVLESVTQEKKKLRSTVSYSAQAPPGYTFVPTGIPELSEFCKERCRKRGLPVHVVSAAPKSKAHVDPDKISHHVHRIGHHFPNEVVDQACNWLGYTGRNGTFEKNFDLAQTSRIAQALEKHKKNSGQGDAANSEQETKEQIQAAMRDLFPRIPNKDMKAIVKHAFRQGTDRVGNAANLSLSRRVQLAVIAHIRHVYTDYDRRLKKGGYLEARANVEHACLEQLRKWRGEQEEDDNIIELEEDFREVIVLDDSDDESDAASNSDDTHERLESVEIMTTQATERDLQAEAYAEPSRPTDARYRGDRRTIIVRHPSDQVFLRRAPPTIEQPFHRDAMPPVRKLVSVAREEPIPSNSRRIIVERSTVFDAPHADSYPRQQLPTYDYPRLQPYPPSRLEPVYVQQTPLYPQPQSSRIAAQRSREAYYSSSDYDSSYSRQRREQGRQERYVPTSEHDTPLPLPLLRPYGYPPEPMRADRELVVPSIESAEAHSPFFRDQRLLPSQQSVRYAEAMTNGNFQHDAPYVQPRRHRSPNGTVPYPRADLQHTYLPRDDIGASQQSAPLFPPRPLWDVERPKSAGEGQQRAIHRRQNMGDRDQDHRVSSNNRHEIVDLTSSPTSRQFPKYHDAYPDESTRTIYGGQHATAVRGMNESAFAFPPNHIASNSKSFLAANYQHPPPANRGPPLQPGSDPMLQSPKRAMSRGPERLGYESFQTDKPSAPISKGETVSRNHRTLPVSSYAPEPIVIDESPPRKKFRNGANQRDMPPSASTGRDNGSSHFSRPVPRHKPVDLDRPQRSRRPGLGGQMDGASVNNMEGRLGEMY